MARTFPAELEAQYGVTISILDSQASTLKKSHINEGEFQLRLCSTHLPVLSPLLSVDDCRPLVLLLPFPFPLPAPLPDPLPEPLDPLRPVLCRFLRSFPKYDSPPLTYKSGSSADPGAPYRSISSGSIVKGSSAPCRCRFRFRPPVWPGCCSGGYLEVISKSPYIRFIRALFSSMNVSILSLCGKTNKTSAQFNPFIVG